MADLDLRNSEGHLLDSLGSSEQEQCAGQHGLGVALYWSANERLNGDHARQETRVQGSLAGVVVNR